MISSLLAVALQASTWIVPPLPAKDAPASPPVPTAASSSDASASSPAPGRAGELQNVLVGAPGIGLGLGGVRCGMSGAPTGSTFVPTVTMRPAASDGSITAAVTDPGSSWQSIRIPGGPDAATWTADAKARYGGAPAIVLRPVRGSCRYASVLVYTDVPDEFVNSPDHPRLPPAVQCPPLSCLASSADALRKANEPRRADDIAACARRELHRTGRLVVVAYDRTASTETVSTIDRTAAVASYFAGASPYSCIAEPAK